MAARRTLALLALIAGLSSGGSSDCSYHGLLEHLNLTTPNTLLEVMRPTKNWTRATEVRLELFLYGILDVNEKSQTVTSHIYVEMHWTSEFLSWETSEFCGINSLTLPRSMIWTPDVSINEDASDSGSIYNDPVLHLQHTGLVRSSMRQRLTHTCRFDLAKFPFDVQRCNITFSSFSSDENSMKLGTVSNDTVVSEVSKKLMTTEGEWKLTNVETYRRKRPFQNSVYSLVAYRVTLVRKPMLYVINLIVPLFFLLMLDLASFFVCEAGGEKLGFKVTVLLSISVLLLILKDILPSTEERMPSIAYHCISVFTLVWLSVLEAILVNFLLDLDRSSREEAQRSAAGQLDAEPGGSGREESPAGEDGGRSKPGGTCFPLHQRSDGELLKTILEEVRAVRQEAGGQSEASGKPGRYRRLAKIIDFVFFTLYFFTVVTFMSYLLAVWI